MFQNILSISLAKVSERVQSFMGGRGEVTTMAKGGKDELNFLKFCHPCKSDPCYPWISSLVHSSDGNGEVTMAKGDADDSLQCNYATFRHARPFLFLTLLKDLFWRWTTLLTLMVIPPPRLIRCCRLPTTRELLPTTGDLQMNWTTLSTC